MTPAQHTIHIVLKDLYDKLNTIESARNREAPIKMMTVVVSFINYTFPESNQGHLMSGITWLVIANNYPSLAKWIMESIDKDLVELTEELTKEINELYLEIRES